MSIVPGLWPEHKNSQRGPFEYNGDLYTPIVRYDDARTRYVVEIARLPNGSENWEIVTYLQSGNSIGQGNLCLSAALVGNTLYVCYSSGILDGAIGMGYCDLDTFVVRTSPGHTNSSNQGIDGTPPLHLVIRSNGDGVVFHQAPTERIMGTDYRRIAVSIYDEVARVWTTITPSFQTGMEINYDARAAILSDDDRVHLFYTQSNLSGGYHIAFLADNSFTEPNNLGNFVSGGAQANYAFGLPDRRLSTIGAIGGQEAWDLYVWRRTPEQFISGTGTGYIGGVTSETTTSNPGAVVFDDNGILHILYVRNDNGNIEHVQDVGNGWDFTASEPFATANTQAISAGLIDGGKSIGVLYDDAGTVTFDKLILIKPPAAPTLIEPVNESIQSGDVAFEWSFNPDPGEPDDVQGGFALCVRDAPWAPGIVDIVSDTPTLSNTGYSTAFSPDGVYLAVAHSGAPYLTIINTSDWSVVPDTPILSNIGYSAAFSPNGVYLAVAYYDTPFLIIINTSDWSVVSGTPTLSNVGRAVAFSPDSAYLAVAHSDTPFLTIINTSDWSVVSGTPTLSNVGYSADFSYDGAYLAIGNSNPPYLTIINTSDWSVVPDTPIPPNIGRAVAFSPDSAYLAVAHSDTPFLTIINTSDWSVVSQTPTLTDMGFGAAFSPDGVYLAVAHSGAPYLTIINTSDWSVVSQTPTLPNTGRAAAFSPDGVYLAVAHSDIPYLTVIMEGYIDQWWDGVDWSSEEIFIESGQTQITIPSGAWTENE